MEKIQEEWMAEETAELSNIIIDHMKIRGLTLEALDKATEIIKRVFYTDAKLKS